ncbi:O-antigen ligase family protein [Lusitaniella coriacea LEGE 07157]|uniref:O-antigen ligase family protein n=1 Tax=Lusitaniella coriacea LEGE 07157 TaxID=945747 RepID=A0A8J7J975_9CYAN|nr:O-antigen ligase family protein [Lusitaniella coriacea]MBE9116275.1 O-antigen ligase family protein [Lusitaniella coriacea LEGE 07157]
MKQILTDPLIASLVAIAGAIYFIVAFHYIGQDSRYSKLLEKFGVGLFVFIIAGATGTTLSPFTKLHPRVLSNTAVTAPTIVAQLGFYAVGILLLVSRLRYTLPNSAAKFPLVLQRDPFLLIFLLLVGLSVFWSDTPEVTFKTSMVYLFVSAVAFYTGKQYSWDKLFFLARWTTLVLLLLSLFYSIFKPGTGRDNDGAWVGIIGHKNQFCFLMVFTALLWFINALYNKKQRNASIFVFLLSFLAVNQGGSGAARVMIVCLLAFWFYLGFAKKLPMQWAFVSVVLFMILGICLTIIVTENLEFIVVDTLNKDLTLTGRTDFWPLIIDKINQRPILGYGIDGFWQPWRGPDNPAREILVAKTQFSPPHSHNGFMDLACDLGYLGLGVFLASFISNIAKAVIYLGQERMPEAGLPILILTYTLMTNMTETGLLGATSIWFWYVVLAVRLSVDLSRKTSRV